MARVVNVHLSALPRGQTDLYHRLWVRITTWRSRCCGELDKYNYKCYVHRVTRIEAAYIRRTMALMLRFESLSFEFDDGSFKGKYRRSTRVVLVQETKKQIWATQMDICVFFYGCDPRPLLVCVGGCAYAPKNKDKYCECWCAVQEVKPGGCVCGCPAASGRTACDGHNDLLMQLTKVVGFLNQVQLQCHPKGAGDTAVGQCQPVSDTAAPCAAGAASGGSACPDSTCSTASGQGSCSAGAAGSAGTCNTGQQSVSATCGAPSGGGDGNTCGGSAGGVGSCGSSTAGGGSTAKCCTYTVHEYDRKQVRVRVECCPIRGSRSDGDGSSASCDGTSSGGQSCYRKLTHTHKGMGNGDSNGTGFRLGDVYHGNCRLDYYGNGSRGQTDSVQQCGGAASGSTCPPNGVGGHCLQNVGSENGRCWAPSSDASTVSQNRWRPLLSVTVYYYNEDKEYCDPLLVVLEFAKNGLNGVQAENGACGSAVGSDGVQNGAKEYYKLTCTGNGKGLVWTKVDNGCKTLENPECLTRFLDQIRYCLKLTLRVHLECKGTNGVGGAGNGYSLMGRKASGGGGQFCETINGAPAKGNGKIEVKVCESKCEALTKGKYKCFRHCLNKALSTKHRQVAGLVFTLPCENGGGQDACCTDPDNGGTSGTNAFVEIPVCVEGQLGGQDDCKTGKANCQAQPGEGLCPSVTPGEGQCAGVSVPSAEGLCAAPAAGTQAICPAGPQNGFTIPPVYYNKCMGDVYVYFYFCKSGGAESCAVGTDRTASSSSSCSPKNGGNDGTDTVPLMVRFNGYFYKPCSRDQYFTKWVCVSELAGVAAKSGCECPCCCGTNADGGSSCTPGKDGAECGDGCGQDCACCATLVQQLNAVNQALNRIDLDPEKAKTASSSGSSKYGLPEKCDKGLRGCKLDPSVGNDRICLTKQEPKNSGKDANGVYVRVVHRTTNGFKIGCLTYCGVDFTKGVTPKGQEPKNGDCTASSGVGVTCPSTSGLGAAQTCNGGLGVGAACSAAGSPSNGTTKITVANGTTGNGHTKLVSDVNANTVVVYYSCTDTCMWLPQLIVILSTDCPVTNGTPVTTKTNYGYYILATKNGDGSGGGAGGSTCAISSVACGGGSGSVAGNSYEYQYRWVEVNGTAGEAGEAAVTLDDKTDFTLLNSAVILMEGKAYSCCTYGEDQIQKAVTSAIGSGSLQASPGNTANDVNRLKNRDITVNNETQTTGSGAGTCSSADAAISPGTCCCKCLTDAGFKVMTHDLCPLVTLNGKFTAPLCNVRLITGLKFLIPTCNKGEYKQLTLNGSSTGANGATDANIKYHKPENNKICVYFYGCDPRPLLLCYNGWAYRANSKDEYDGQKWAACTDGVKCQCTQAPGKCQCTQGKCDQCPLLKALVQVSDFLNPVDIKQVPQSSGDSRFCRCYQVHQFNGQRVWIRVSAQFACGPFCYNRFTHTHAGIRGNGTGFRLGNIHYNLITGKNGVTNGSSTCIKLNGTNNGDNGCINSVITKNGQSSGKPCETASHVVAFYYKLDSEHKTPIVVALCSNGTTGSSTCDKLECKLYYVLKDLAGKKYERGTNGLDMDKDDELSKQLDDALFKNSKKLQIVLSQRPQPAKYSEGSDNKKCIVNGLKNGETSGQDELRTCKFNLSTELEESKQDSLLYHVGKETSYEANLCEKNGIQPESEPKTIKITVEEVKNCSTLYKNGGYRCFKHGLTTASGISEVGGLVLCLWADKGGAGQGSGGKCAPCTEQGGKAGGQDLQLCTVTGSAGTKNGSIQLSYTTCKGDLYVFFYGEDPRPLLLCYNGEAYYPKTMGDYCSKWVKVGNGSTKCVENGQVKANEKVLKALFEVSMFLNPVYLVLCSDAYGKLDPKHGQESQPEGQQEQNGASGQNGHQQPEQDKHHSYTIHPESRPPICIKVTGRDLRCYREYVHRPEKQGFRLGEVRYVKAAEGGGTLGAGTNSGQCQTTTTGGDSAASTCSPSTDTGTTISCSTPTTTSTANNGFCFEYDCKKQLQTVSLYHYMYDKCHNWPLVVMLSYKGHGSEFFRLCCPGETAGGAGDGDTSGGGTCQGSGGGSNGGGDSNGQKCSGKKVDPRCLKWVKMGPESGGQSCKNGAESVGGNGNNQDQCAPCPANSGASGTSEAADSTSAESADMCQEDAQFVERAKELYRSVHAWDFPSSVFTEDRLPLTRELSDLIEGRAYQIRKSLQIDYERDEKCLILATASHCWEEWPLAYIVGGSAVGVLGGTGWKFVVMAVGVFVKL